jgi:hypothetical protein
MIALENDSLRNDKMIALEIQILRDERYCFARNLKVRYEACHSRISTHILAMAMHAFFPGDFLECKLVYKRKANTLKRSKFSSK